MVTQGHFGIPFFERYSTIEYSSRTYAEQEDYIIIFHEVQHLVWEIKLQYEEQRCLSAYC
jgi:hypothetical protein